MTLHRPDYEMCVLVMSANMAPVIPAFFATSETSYIGHRPKCGRQFPDLLWLDERIAAERVMLQNSIFVTDTG